MHLSASSPTTRALLSGAFKKLTRILFHPTYFFQTLPLNENLAYPISFGLIIHWLATAIEAISYHALFPQESFFLSMMPEGVQNFQTSVLSAQWLTSIGSVVLDPFFTTASILINSAIMFLAARFLFPDCSFYTPVRAYAYALSGSALRIIPIGGQFIASIYVFVLTVIGLRELFRTSNGKAVFMAVFPKLLIMSIILSFALFISAFFLQFLALSF